MPSKIDPNDWDRLFAPGAPKRGGPLRVIGTTLVGLTLLAAIAVGATLAIGYRDRQMSAAASAATAYAVTAGPGLTATTAAFAAAEDRRSTTATAAALGILATPSPVPGIGSGIIARNGNLRSEPRIAPETVRGLVWVGDTVTILERQAVGEQTWYRIKIVIPAPNRAAEGAAEGSEGWVSATLLTPGS